MLYHLLYGMYTKLLTKLIAETKDNSPEPNEIISKYSEATDFDKCIILLRSYKYTYGQISSKMGSPSKKAIRESLLKWAPELIEEDCNRNKLKAKERASREEFELINLLRKTDAIKPYYMGHPLLGHWRFVITEGRLYYVEDDNSVGAFGDYDYICQYQFLNIIKDELTKRI